VNTTIRPSRIIALIVLAMLVGLCGAICVPRTEPPPVEGCTYTAISSDITTDTTLPTGCYDLPYTISVTAGLTLQPGTTVRCQAGAMLLIESAGSLNAVGTVADPITFTGATAARGFWSGISFLGGSSSNTLGHMVIEYAGQADGGGLTLFGDSAPVSASISDCTLRHCAGYGLKASGAVDLTGFARNDLTQNAEGPCKLPPNAVRFLDLASTYQGNDVNAIVLSSGTVTDTQFWSDLEVEYLATNIQVAADLTILPGVTIAFTSGGAMNVQSTGSLRAVGVPTREITFTGATQTPGFWEGVSYTNTSAATNVLTLVTMEYAGATAGCLMLNTPPVVVSATYCTFAHSATCGVWVAGGGTINPDVETVNTFTDTPGGTVCP
jgi:hypothetical protein